MTLMGYSSTARAATSESLLCAVELEFILGGVLDSSPTDDHILRSALIELCRVNGHGGLCERGHGCIRSQILAPDNFLEGDGLVGNHVDAVLAGEVSEKHGVLFAVGKHRIAVARCKHLHGAEAVVAVLFASLFFEQAAELSLCFFKAGKLFISHPILVSPCHNVRFLLLHLFPPFLYEIDGLHVFWFHKGYRGKGYL